MKRLIFIAAIISLCACKKTETPSIIGKWSLESTETSRENGEKLTDKDGELVDVIVDDNPTGIMVVNADNTFSNSNLSGTYTLSGNKITFDYGSSTQTAELSLSAIEMKLVFKEGGFVIVNYWIRL